MILPNNLQVVSNQLEMAAPAAFRLDPGMVYEHARCSMRPDQFDQFAKITDYFGVPAQKNEMTITRSRDTLDLWQLWEGFNETVAGFVNRDLVATGNWITSLFPREEQQGMSGELIEFVCEPQVPADVAENAPNQLLEMHTEKRQWSMRLKGLGFESNVDFVFSPNGLQLFGERCKQMEMSLDNGLSYEVLSTVFRHGYIQMLRQFPKKPMSKSDFARLRGELTSMFAAFQKTFRGHDKIEARGVELLMNQHIQPTKSIDPSSGSVRFVRNTDRSHTVAAIGGEEGIKDRSIDTDQRVLISRATDHPIQVHASRAFKLRDNLPAHNPAFVRRTIGEYYFAGDLTSPEGLLPLDQYRTAHRAITLADAEGSRRSISLKEMVDHSGLFDGSEEGRLTSLGRKVAQRLIEYSPERKGGVRKIASSIGSLADCNPWTSRKRKSPSDEDDGPAGDFTLNALFKAAGWLGSVTDYLERCEQKAGGAGGGGLGLAAGAQLVSPADKIKEIRLMIQNVNKETLTRENVNQLLQNNIPLPINFLLFRPWIIFDTGAYILLRHGRETGVLKHNRAQVAFGRNVHNRTITVQMNYAAKTVIGTQGERNIALFPDVYVNRYHGGYDTQIHLPDGTDVGNYQEQLIRQNELKSVFALAVPANYKPCESYMDITGFVSTDLLQQTQTAPEPMYPTACEYARHYCWAPSGTDFLTLKQFEEQDPFSNTWVNRGYCQIHTPRELKLGDNDQNEILGTGHLGQRITPKTFRVLMGEDDTMEEVIKVS